MYFITSILKGIAIGAGAILPGISSGVLCVLFGIYENLVNSILGLFKDFKKNFLFLLPIAIGVFIGVVLFGNILRYLFSNFNTFIRFIFIGLILGSLPSLFKEVNLKKGFRVSYLFYTLITFLIGMFLIYLENNFVVSFASISFPYLFLCGFLMSIGIVFPGISSTVILMLLGIYYVYLEAVSILNITVLVPIILGLLVGSIIFLIVIKYLLSTFYVQTFYSIIGFVLSSIFVLLPSEFSFLGLVLIFLGLLISVLITKK